MATAYKRGYFNDKCNTHLCRCPQDSLPLCSYSLPTKITSKDSMVIKQVRQLQSEHPKSDVFCGHEARPTGFGIPTPNPCLNIMLPIPTRTIFKQSGRLSTTQGDGVIKDRTNHIRAPCKWGFSSSLLPYPIGKIFEYKVCRMMYALWRKTTKKKFFMARKREALSGT